jgi:murein DD-endopeptidase MepM/ murein hydrolase activator NlpD
MKPNPCSPRSDSRAISGTCATRRHAVLLVALIVTGCARARPEVAPRPIDISDADIEYFTAHPLMVPVDGVDPSKVPDSFHEPRGDGHIHNATDILAPRETPVVAAIAGKVMRLRQNAAGGITAYLIDEEGLYVYYYAHLSHYSDKITEGLDVPQGFVIGYVGTSGNAPPDTPHLHFQVMRFAPGHRDWWNGTPVDVRPLMKRTGKALE